MLSEAVYSWPQDSWSFIVNEENTNSDTVDTNTLLEATHSAKLQLQYLFGQDAFDFIDTFCCDEMGQDEGSNTVHSTYLETSVQALPDSVLGKRRRGSGITTISDYDLSCPDDEEQGTFFDFQTVEQDETESEWVFSSLERRQLEELILDKMTNQLNPEKIPGMLAIISSQFEDGEEEIEIDLAELNIDELKRIMYYIDTCLLEEESSESELSALSDEDSQLYYYDGRNTIAENYDITNALLDNYQFSSSKDPLFMGSSTDSDAESVVVQRMKQTKTGIRDTEKCGLHKSNKKSVGQKRETVKGTKEANNGILIIGDEEMDFAVTQNQTIAHKQKRRKSIIIQSSAYIEHHFDDEIDDDELIDIMI